VEGYVDTNNFAYNPLPNSLFNGQILSTRFDTHCYHNRSTFLTSYNQYQARQLQSIAMSQSDVQSPSSSKTKRSFGSTKSETTAAKKPLSFL
jgi:hypothetical protein